MLAGTSRNSARVKATRTLNRCIHFASKKQLDLWTGSSKSKSRGRHAQSRYDEFRLQLEIREAMEIGLAGKHYYCGNAPHQQRDDARRVPDGCLAMRGPSFLILRQDSSGRSCIGVLRSRGGRAPPQDLLQSPKAEAGGGFWSLFESEQLG